jgi:K+-sensing histidine kinase KdpD
MAGSPDDLPNIQEETRLADDLLHVSKISRGALEVRRDFMDLHDAIQAAISTQRKCTPPSRSFLADFFPVSLLDPAYRQQE